MQTPLLGLAIAVILALLAALVGPYFIDWSQFRPEFEREASRVIGLPVRVDGAIDARLLPTPSLSLRGVAIGSRSDANNVSVEKLDVEFSLGELMRGEWRANELSLNGLILELALDEKGGFNWGARPGGFNLGALTVDRFHVTGAAALSDTANRRSLQLDDIAFTGEVRALAGSIRGEGALKVDGLRTPFRLATGRTADGSGQRVRLSLEQAERALAADLDGLVQFDKSVPRFDGSLSLSRPAQAKGAAAAMPWRLGGKLKADPASARFDQMEAVLGPDETGLKFSGEAEARFGASPRVRAALRARQLDADRFLAQGNGKGNAAAPSPAQMLSRFRELIASAPSMPLATELNIDAELVNLGARPVQNAAIELRANASEWTVERLEFRAPGAARVSLTGRVTEPGENGAFSGALTLDAGDPEGFALWLQGQGDNAYRVQKPLKARGDLLVSSRQVAVEALTAEIDGRRVEGKFSLGANGGKSRFDAALKAEKLDFDAASAFARAFGGALKTWPDEGDVSLDVAQLGVGGQTLKPVLGRLTYDAKLISLQRLRIGDADGVAIDGNGAFDRASAMGQMNFGATAATLDPLARLVEPLAPAFARRIAAVPAGAGNIWVGLSLDLDKPQGDLAGVKASLDIHAPQLKGSLAATMTPRLAALQALDADALMKTEANVAARIGADRSDALLALLGLDGVLAAGEGPAHFEASAAGVWNEPLKLKAALQGPGLDAALDGSAELFKGERAGTLAVSVRKADLAPLLGAARPVALSLSSQATIAGARIDLDKIDGTLAGSTLRGKLAMSLGDELGLDGDLSADTLDVPAVLLAAIGASGHDSAEPLNRGLLSGWRGRVAISAKQATLPGGEVRPLGGAVKHDGQALVFENLTGGLGGGKIEGNLAARKSPEGVNLTGRIRLADADGAALKLRGLAMPAGRVSAQVTVNGHGRSAASLLGSLGGNGAVSIAQAKISGLDPRAFEAAIRASDAGVARDDAKLAAAVDPVLAAGVLAVPSAEIPFTIRDGQLRVSNTTLMGEGARLNLSGGYDIAADQMDVRAALSATATDTANIGRPEILVLLFGSPDRPDRSLDVAALSSWLGLRAIDRETRRLDAIEKTNPLLNPSRAPDTAPPEPQPARPSPPPSPPATPRADVPSQATAPPLPPPVEVKPAPGASRPPQRHNAPLVIAPRF